MAVRLLPFKTEKVNHRNKVTDFEFESGETIWIFNHYASTPDQPSTSAYFLAEELVRRGAKVTFFASAFNYYFQADRKSSGLGLTTRENVGGVEFVWLRTPSIAGGVGRAINMACYTIVALLVGLFGRGKPNYVIGVCPHPGAALSAWLVSVFRRAHFIYEIRDFWPESLEKHISGPLGTLAYKLMFAMQTFLYRRAKLIVSVLPEIARYLDDRGIAGAKSLYVPNCINLEKASGDFSEIINKRPGRFNFVYCGGFSKYQGIGVILEAFKDLSNRVGGDKVQLHMIGEGSEKAAFLKIAEENSHKNIEVYEAVPRTEVQRVLQSADCNVFHLSDIGSALKYGISPNKLIEYLASEKPLVYAMPENWSLLAEGDVGFYSKPDDVTALSEAMEMMLAASEKDRSRFAENARKTANFFDVKQVGNRFGTALSKL